MRSDICSALKSLHHSGNCKNFNFDKYCTAHVEQHNQHTTLTEFNMEPLGESMKIYYFEDGVTNLSLTPQEHHHG